MKPVYRHTVTLKFYDAFRLTYYYLKHGWQRVWPLIIATIVILVWTIYSYSTYAAFSWETNIFDLWFPLLIGWAIRGFDISAQTFLIKPTLSTCDASIERKVIPRWPFWMFYVGLILLTMYAKYTASFRSFDLIPLHVLLGVASLCRTVRMTLCCIKCLIFEMIHIDLHRNDGKQVIFDKLTV
jgi:hypothetical protein